jgi:hypothetical protein
MLQTSQSNLKQMFNLALQEMEYQLQIGNTDLVPYKPLIDNIMDLMEEEYKTGCALELYWWFPSMETTYDVSINY